MAKARVARARVMPRLHHHHRYDADANGTLNMDEFRVVVNQIDTVLANPFGNPLLHLA